MKRFHEMNETEKRESIKARTGRATYDRKTFEEDFPNYKDKKIGIRYERGLGSYVLNMSSWHGPDGSKMMLSEAVEFCNFFCIEGWVPDATDATDERCPHFGGFCSKDPTTCEGDDFPGDSIGCPYGVG